MITYLNRGWLRQRTTFDLACVAFISSKSGNLALCKSARLLASMCWFARTKLIWSSFHFRWKGRNCLDAIAETGRDENKDV